MGAGPFSFIIMGIFLVAAGVLLLDQSSALGDSFYLETGRASFRSNRRCIAHQFGLSHGHSIPYSDDHGMFSLVIFAAVIFIGYSALFGYYLMISARESGGEYEILAFSSSELDPDVSQWDLGEMNVTDFRLICNHLQRCCEG